MLKKFFILFYTILASSITFAQSFSQETTYMRVKIIEITQTKDIPEEKPSEQTTESNNSEQMQKDPFAPDLSGISDDQTNQESENHTSIIDTHNDELTVTKFSILILDGPFKGENREIIFKGTDSMPDYAKYKKGDTVFAGYNRIGMGAETERYFALYDVDNGYGIIAGVIFLLTVVIIVGRFKGVMAIVSIIPTALMVFLGFIPLVLKGFPALPAAIIVCILSIAITIPLITGFSKKSLAAILGASAGVVLSAIIALSFGYLMHLAGIITDEMITVFYISDVNLDLKDLALSGMIIAALGAVIDVAISLASASAEIWNANPDLDKKTAFRSVTTVGTDILGATVNTLILAYIGSSLSLILLVSLKFNLQMPIMMIFSHNPVLVEIIKSIVGSAGMFLSIPATAYIAVQLYFTNNLKSKKGGK